MKNVFLELTGKYGSEPAQQRLWQEVESAYTGRKRYYHNLSHLKHLLGVLTNFRQLADDWDVLLFALFYHDLVYNVLKQNNEEESADIAGKRMAELGLSAGEIARCRAHIAATQSHSGAADADTRLFTDADLAILGSDRVSYETYMKNARKEYAIYPDVVYNPGRKKVLRHFLNMERIFKTDQLTEKYELKARENLSWELEML